MAPQYKKEMIICKLKYVPFAVAKDDFTVERNQSAMSLIDLVDGLIWFLGVVQKEKAKLLPGSELRFVEWTFKSNNSDLMTINNVRYDEMRVVLGGENVHWFFYSVAASKTIQGSQDLPVCYCSCCFNLQYLKVILMVKNYVTLQM